MVVALHVFGDIVTIVRRQKSRYYSYHHAHDPEVAMSAMWQFYQDCIIDEAGTVGVSDNMVQASKVPGERV